MTTEYGIFGDEGLVEGDFYSKEEAKKRLEKEYPDSGLWVDECCIEHREQRKEHCEECQYLDEMEEDEHTVDSETED